MKQSYRGLGQAYRNCLRFDAMHAGICKECCTPSTHRPIEQVCCSRQGLILRCQQGASGRSLSFLLQNAACLASHCSFVAIICDCCGFELQCSATAVLVQQRQRTATTSTLQRLLVRSGQDRAATAKHLPGRATAAVIIQQRQCTTATLQWAQI